MEELIKRVNANITGIFKRDPKPVVILSKRLSLIIGDDSVHISEFIVAKIKGRINNYTGHLEVTDEILLDVPFHLTNPKEIIKDTRTNEKYLFISNWPFLEIAIEVKRSETGKTEINTIHIIRSRELKRLENKFPVVFSSGGAP